MDAVPLHYWSLYTMTIMRSPHNMYSDERIHNVGARHPQMSGKMENVRTAVPRPRSQNLSFLTTCDRPITCINAIA
ncbi:MAG: hypothetical protein AB4352_14295 [Hormoscilla sp.]